MKIHHLILIGICAGFTCRLSADDFANTDDASRAAALARQANTQLQDASSAKDYEAAAALLEQSVELNPNDLDVRQTLGWVYLDKLHEPRKAYPQCEVVAKGRPTDVNARKLYAMACFQTGRSRKAAEEFGAAEKLEPNDLWVRANLGRSLARIGKWHEAMDIYAGVLLSDPHNPDARLGQAEIYAWSGHSGRALEILDELIREDPNNLEALTLRADVRRWDWDLAGARQDYKQVLEDNPDDGDAQSGIRQCTAAGAPSLTVTAYQFKDTTDFRREYLEADGRLHVTDHAYLLGGVAGWRFTNPGFSDLNRGDASAGMEFDFTRWLQIIAEGDAFKYDNVDAFYGGHFTTKISLMPGSDIYLSGSLHQPYVWSILTVEEALKQNSVGAGLDTKLAGRLSFQIQSQGATISDRNSWWEATPQLSWRLLNVPQTFIRVQGDYLSYSETRTNYWTPQQRYTLGPVFDTSIPIFKALRLEGDAKAPYIFDEHKFGYEFTGGPVIDIYNHIKLKADYYYDHIPGSQGEWSGQGWQASIQVIF